MCGIAAIYSYRHSGSPMDRDELIRIRDHMAPRGPDGKGAWFSTDGRVGLGHRRLSIIDLSARAAQPMVLNDDHAIESADNGNLSANNQYHITRNPEPGTTPRFVITYNGEIYNFKALRRKLEAEGSVFFSDSDTEVLLRLYATKGERMVHDLRGMFAFALWDAARSALFMARDPYGIKPLYYADDGQTVRTASLVKAIQAGGRVSRAKEPAGVAGFFLFGSVPEPWTTFEGIRALPAGATLWVDETGVRSPRTYFSIPATFKRGLEWRPSQSETRIDARVRAALLDSVERHLVADVAVGAFLSSGIDSGALVGMMADLAHEDIRTVTLAFAEFHGTPDDESPLARKTAERYATRHTSRIVTEADFRDVLPRLLSDMDQPSIDGVNTWFVSRAAAESGLKVAVSGLGGDELFGGYPSFRDIPRWVRYCKGPSRIPGLGELFLRLHRSLVSAPWQFKTRPALAIPCSPKAAGFLKYAGTYPGAYLLRRGLFMPWELPELMGEDAAAEGLRRLDPVDYIRNCMTPDPGTPFARVAALEASVYMRNQLLRDADWAGMAHGLEIRLPLVDSFLLKKLAPFLAGQGSMDKKHLLAGAPARPLPHEVVSRPKTGFVVPIRQWILKNPDLDAWRVIPFLRTDGCHWSRRWAYTIMKRLSN